MSNDKSTLAPFLRKLEVFAELKPAARAAILELPVRLRAVESSTFLLREGDEPTTCTILVSGYAFRQKRTGEGARQILSLHIPGEALDLQHLYLGVADHSIQMLSRGEVAIAQRKDLHALLDAHPTFARAMLRHVMVEASIAREWVLNIGRRDAKSRMAHVLCEFAVRVQSQGLTGAGGYELPITQEQMADVLGMTPVHVNRTLKALEALGLIVRDRRTINFPSWEKLRDAGDFNRRYLHMDEPVRAA